MRRLLPLWVLAGATGCDFQAVPTTADDGIGRPAVLARAQLEVEGLAPGLDAMIVSVDSLAIRRTRDQHWLPLVVGATEVALTPDEPLAEIAMVPLGADTYDRLELQCTAISVIREGEERQADLDRQDATLAVQWRLDRNVDMVLRLDYREDVELTAESLDVVFAPLPELRY